MVTVATLGDYGKPRPALIVQADAYAEHPSITVLPLTSELHDMPLLRITVEPGEGTGLRLRSQIMVEGDHHPTRQGWKPDRLARCGHSGRHRPSLGRLPRSRVARRGRDHE